MTETLSRSSQVADYTGRTLEGRAYSYGNPSRVTDDAWKTSYFEEIVSGADAKTLRERGTYPVDVMHAGESIGSVTFHHSDDEKALMFRAVIDPSEEGDRILEDIANWSDVSVAFDALRSAQRVTEYHGPITQRKEIRLRALAIAATGTGLVKDAGIQVVRSAGLETPKLIELRARLLRL
jgi:hypothetical protein